MWADLLNRVGLEGVSQRLHEGRLHALAKQRVQARTKLAVSYSQEGNGRCAHRGAGAVHIHLHPLNQLLHIQLLQPKLLNGCCHPPQSFAQHLY